MNENEVRKSVLRFQRESIQPTIATIALPGIHIMRGQHNSFTEQTVIQHEERSIEDFELIVPQNVENS
jgi:hypothetical protein